MKVFRLDSDDRYITPATSSEGKSVDVFVYNYLEESNGGERKVARVGPSRAADFDALQLWGVTIEGEEQFQELVTDLNLKSSRTRSRSYRLGVNRFGLCSIRGIDLPLTNYLRINDYFGWSKYGVKPPLPPEHYPIGGRNVRNSRNVFDLDELVVDVRGIVVAAREAKDLRRRVEEVEKEAEEVRSELAVCKKELECVEEAVERSERSRVVWEKLAEEEDEKVEGLKSQLFDFRVALVSLFEDRYGGDDDAEEE